MLAWRYLVSCGWEVERHRFRMGRQEIDLVVRRGGVVAFVEVKTRWSGACGAPAEAVGWRKRRAIARVAAAWQDRYGRPDDLYRFDLVTVTPGREGRPQVEHLPDAWRLEGYR
jgi:putative endonuclease